MAMPIEVSIVELAWTAVALQMKMMNQTSQTTLPRTGSRMSLRMYSQRLLCLTRTTHPRTLRPRLRLRLGLRSAHRQHPYQWAADAMEMPMARQTFSEAVPAEGHGTQFCSA